MPTEAAAKAALATAEASEDADASAEAQKALKEVQHTLAKVAADKNPGAKVKYSEGYMACECMAHLLLHNNLNELVACVRHDIWCQTQQHI